MMENLSQTELIRLEERTAGGGNYEAARRLINLELEQRALAILALGSVDMPVWEEDEEETNIERGRE